MATRQQLEQALQNPNARKFLNLISFSEGTQGNGYATAFGGGRLSNLNDHPRYLKPFKQKNGQINYTSAAGRYQFVQKTWDNVARQLGLADFSPHSQDLGALKLLADRGALGDVLNGDYQKAVVKAGNEWASFPTAPDSYSQPKHSWAKFHAFWNGTAGNRGGQGNYSPQDERPPLISVRNLTPIRPPTVSVNNLTPIDTPSPINERPPMVNVADLTPISTSSDMPIDVSTANTTQNNGVQSSSEDTRPPLVHIAQLTPLGTQPQANDIGLGLPNVEGLQKNTTSTA